MRDQIEEAGNTLGEACVVRNGVLVVLGVIYHESLVAGAKVSEHQTRQIALTQQGVKGLVDALARNDKIFILFGKTQKADEVVEIIARVIETALRSKQRQSRNAILVDIETLDDMMRAVPTDHVVLKADILLGQEVKYLGYEVHGLPLLMKREDSHLCASIDLAPTAA